MARKKAQKIQEGVYDTGETVDSFGEKVSKHDLLSDGAEVQQLKVKSKTNLEDDLGEGKAAIIRCFTFGMNLHSFQEAKPSKQELFNSHLKGIEVALWRDGMNVMTEVTPRVTFDTKNMTYQIFVGARPMKGHILREQPQTLSQVVHGV